MTSNHTHAFVWIWLPGEIEPVVAGRLSSEGQMLIFNYGQSYLNRENAIPIFDPELPLQAGALPLLDGLNMPACLRDAAPDAWGRRVIINKKISENAHDAELGELTYLLESGSDRIGALDFQHSPEQYEPRLSDTASLDDLLQSAERVEQGIPLTGTLGLALQHGTAIGGARPKALLDDQNKKHIAKFSSSSDTYSIVKAEFIAMRLAKIAGLSVANVDLQQVSNKDVLLIERFDRIETKSGWQRRLMISALTLFGFDDRSAYYASYEKLAELIRHRFSDSKKTLKELFSRLVFNIMIGNTDDHARNHAAFWDGEMLSLTPAYDLLPMVRTGGEATQAMIIAGGNRFSRISSCIEAAGIFHLSQKDAVDIIESQLHCIEKNWLPLCDEADLSKVDRNLLWGRAILNPYAFECLPDDLAHLKKAADKIREKVR